MKKHFFAFFGILLSVVSSQAQPKIPLDRQAQLYMQNGDFVTAIAIYDQLLEKDSMNAEYLVNRGWAKLNASSFTRGAEDLLRSATINKQCSRCFIGLAIYSMQNGILEDALEQANMAVKTGDTASFNYFIRAQIYETMGDSYKASKDFNKAIELNPMMADYYYSRGNFLFHLGKYENAIDDFSNAILLEPAISDFYFQRGYTHFMLKQLNYAVIDVNKAIDLDSNNADYWLGKGTIEEAIGNYTEAKKSYSETVRINPYNALAYFNRANIYFENAELDSSCSDYNRCIQALSVSKYPREDMYQEAVAMIGNHCDTSLPSYYYQRGLTAIDLKQYQEALDILNQGHLRWPDHPLINAFRGNALLGMKKYTYAAAAYEDALHNSSEIPEDVRNSYTLKSNQVSPDIYMRQLFVSVYDGLSKCYLSVGKLDESLECVNKAIFLTSKLQESPILTLKLLKANILSSMNEDVQALKILEDLIKMNPEFASSYVIRGRILLKQAIAKGNKRAKFLYASSPQSGMYYMEVPRHFKESKVDQVMASSALADIRIALALNPDFAEAYFVMGEIKLLSGLSDYCQDFLKAKTLGITDAMELLNSPCPQPKE
ncbi:MAG: tetratricopeptide repeat protein [Bacteroidetes bacterium]|nr:tetratricopeptide repeat protein [Bacteroidota bacterium]